MKLFLQEPLDWLYPDRIQNTRKSMSRKIADVPRGGIASFALVLTGLTPGKEVSFASNLPECRLSEMVDVCVNANTGENGFSECSWSPKSKSVTRVAPFRVFDALKPLDGCFVPKNECAALYLQIPVRRNAKPGMQEIELRFTDGKQQCGGTCGIRVSMVRLPESGKDSVHFTNWFDANSMQHFTKAKKWTPAFWKRLAEHAAMMKHARQNTFWVPLKLFMEYNDGKFTVNRSRLKKIVQIFTDAGLYWIEGGHIGERKDNQWNATDFVVQFTGNSVRSIQGNRDIAAICAILKEEIRRNGWGDRWIQHVVDEPIACNADSYRIFSGLVRKYLPGVPLLDAMSDPNIAGAPNIWCPQVQEYQTQKELFEETRKQGDHIWAYTCCMPGGPYLNRLIDGELARPCLLGWGCGANGIEGFLHWGWNMYIHFHKAEVWQDPFECTAPVFGDDSPNRLPPGDTHLVYPAPDGGVWSSMRLEAQREGIEDWELIRMLRKKDPTKCTKITGMVFRQFNDFTPSGAAIRKARQALLEALEQA